VLPPDILLRGNVSNPAASNLLAIIAKPGP
jgi:hypothetical protein